MRRFYHNERGFALVLAMILSLVVLATVSALIYILIQGTTMSGYQKRYETALESAKGGANLVTDVIIPQAVGQTTAANLSALETTLTNTYNVSSPLNLNLTFPYTTSTCLLAKMTQTTLTNGTDNWKAAGCNANMESPNLSVCSQAGTMCASNSDCPNSAGGETCNAIPDMSFVLPGPTAAQNFIVNAKIVNTVQGNTSISGLDLQGSGVVESGSGMVTPQQVPYLYRIELQAERQTNPDESAYLSVLYAY